MIIKAFAAIGVVVIYLLCVFTAAYAIAFLSDMRDDDFDVCMIANVIQAVIVIISLWERILK
jgi:hypothetical protein